MIIIRRTKKDWITVIEEQKLSNLSQQEFCDARNINLLTFRKMKSKFSKDTVETDSKEINDDGVSWTLISYNESYDNKPIDIEIGGFKIKVEDNFNLKNFKKICEVLKSIC